MSNLEREDTKNGLWPQSIPVQQLDAQVVSKIARNEWSQSRYISVKQHVVDRRQGMEDIFFYLSHLSNDTQISLTQTCVGKVYQPNGVIKTKQLRSLGDKQSYLTEYQNSLSFVTNRFVGTIHFENLDISLPAWVIAMHEIKTACDNLQTAYPTYQYPNNFILTDREFIIDQIAADYGWHTSLVGMLACGHSLDYGIGQLTYIKRRNPDLPIPAASLMNPKNGLSKLRKQLAHPPQIGNRLVLEKDVLGNLKEMMRLLYGSVSERWSIQQKIVLQAAKERSDQSQTINLKSGTISFVLPSENEIAIDKLVQSGYDKDQINRMRDSESGLNNVFTAFRTIYLNCYINDVDFYPITRHNVDKEIADPEAQKFRS